MPLPLVPLALALFLPGCVAAVPAAGYVAGAATSAGATYLGNATFDYAGRRMRVEEMDCDDLRIAYAHAPVNRSRLVNRYTDWLTTRGMIEDQAEEIGCALPPPAEIPAAIADTVATEAAPEGTGTASTTAPPTAD